MSTSSCNSAIRRSLRHFVVSLAALGVLAAFRPVVIAAQEAEKKAFNDAVEKWRGTLKAAATAYYELEYADEEQFIALREQLINFKAQGDTERKEVILNGARLYRVLSENDEKLRDFLERIDLYSKYQYALDAEVKSALHSKNTNSIEHHFNALKSAFFANNFTLAQELLDQWLPLHGAMPPEVTAISTALPVYKKRWEEWQAELAARPAGQVNPLLSITTPRGVLVIELDEDRYPVIVSNLVNMVESSRMYKGSGLFEVIEHQRIRGGCPQNNGTTAIPVARINPEVMKSAPLNFRGAFSLMIDPKGARVTSQFVISRTPGVDLEGFFLPVGRVVSGMDVVDQIPKTHTLNDKLEFEKIEGVELETISDVAITKKRDHEYKQLDEVQDVP